MDTDPSPKRDFFISYSSSDKSWAEWIAWQLEANDFSTILMAWDFTPGSNFVAEMDTAFAKTHKTICLLSPEYLKRAYTQEEWMTAWNSERTRKNKTLIPIRVKDCELTGLLAQVVYLDLVGLHDEDKARQVLLNGVGESRIKPRSQPIFPGRLSSPVFFPGNLPRQQASDVSKASRFFHTKIHPEALHDGQNPYIQLVDATDQTIPDSVSHVYSFTWLPQCQYLQSNGLQAFSTVCSICSAYPNEICSKLKNTLGSRLLGRLSVPPRKLLNSEKEELFRICSGILRNSLVVCVAFPSIIMGVADREPTLAYQAIVDLMFLPLFEAHKQKYDIQQFECYLSKVGECDAAVLRAFKRTLAASFPRKGSSNFAHDSSEEKNLIYISRLFSWAVNTYYNSGDSSWISLVSNIFDLEGDSSPMEESPVS